MARSASYDLYGTMETNTTTTTPSQIEGTSHQNDKHISDDEESLSHSRMSSTGICIKNFYFNC